MKKLLTFIVKLKVKKYFSVLIVFFSNKSALFYFTKNSLKNVIQNKKNPIQNIFLSFLFVSRVFTSLSIV
jgi:hypothetical protein